MSIAYTHRRFNQTKDYGDLLFYAPLDEPSYLQPTFAKDGNYNILDINILQPYPPHNIPYTFFNTLDYCIWETFIPTNLPAYTLNCWIVPTTKANYTFGLFNLSSNKPSNRLSLQNYIDIPYGVGANIREMRLRYTNYNIGAGNEIVVSDSFHNSEINNCLISMVITGNPGNTFCNFYINGVYHGIPFGVGESFIYPHPCIGDVVFKNNQTLEGNYSHFSIYGKAMTQQEILNLYYNGGVPPEI